MNDFFDTIRMYHTNTKLKLHMYVAEKTASVKS